MKTVKVTFDDGNTVVTSINGTPDEIRHYYMGQYFQFGDTPDHPADKLRRAIAVDFIR